MTYDDYIKQQFELNPQVMAFAIDEGSSIFGYMYEPKPDNLRHVWASRTSEVLKMDFDHLTEVPAWDKSLRIRETPVRKLNVVKDREDDWMVEILPCRSRFLDNVRSHSGYLGIETKDGARYRSLDHMAQKLGLPLDKHLVDAKVVFKS